MTPALETVRRAADDSIDALIGESVRKERIGDTQAQFGVVPVASRLLPKEQ